MEADNAKYTDKKLKCYRNTFSTALLPEIECVLFNEHIQYKCVEIVQIFITKYVSYRRGEMTICWYCFCLSYQPFDTSSQTTAEEFALFINFVCFISCLKNCLAGTIFQKPFERSIKCIQWALKS